MVRPLQLTFLRWNGGASWAGADQIVVFRKCLKAIMAWLACNRAKIKG
jgi:hypothetical protein